MLDCVLQERTSDNNCSRFLRYKYTDENTNIKTYLDIKMCKCIHSIHVLHSKCLFFILTSSDFEQAHKVTRT